MTNNFILKGISVSPGVSIGNIYKINPINLDLDCAGGRDPEGELSRLRQAQESVREEIEHLKAAALEKHDDWTVGIFDTHLFLIHDPELTERVEMTLTERGVSAEYAILEVRNSFVEVLESSGSEMMKERSADITDLTNRIISFLTGQKVSGFLEIEGQVIILAQEISPLEVSQMDTTRVLGIITEAGGRTSHTAILARSLGIPAVAGVKDGYKLIDDDAYVILDGREGRICVNPALDELKSAENQIKAEAENKKLLDGYKENKTITREGIPVMLRSNINRIEDVEKAIENGAEGIGLFRTEFLFMNSGAFPDEDTQLLYYRKILEKMESFPVIIRTLDIGGDKILPYADFPEEGNPFLGLRGIRYSLKNTEIFKTQLRALIRAGGYGNLKIMFPMVSTIQEYRSARKLFDECIDELGTDYFPGSEKIEIGIMIEVPAAALIAEELANITDFFCIGTNDLIQYTMAVDRMNENVSYLYQPFHPALLRLIKMVTNAAKHRGIRTSVCGELASDPEAIPLLLGSGVDELSMSSSMIPAARELISRTGLKEMISLADSALKKRL